MKLIYTVLLIIVAKAASHMVRPEDKPFVIQVVLSILVATVFVFGMVKVTDWLTKNDNV